MSLKIYHFKLPFTHPLVTAKGTFSSREGLLIQATIGGFTCWSEVSPLPGFSTTSLNDCISWFKRNETVVTNFLARNFSALSEHKSVQDIIHLIASSTEHNFPTDTPNEILFAFDTLLFQAISQNSTLKLDSSIRIGVNATASDLITAQSKIQSGFKTIKFKVGVDWPSEINSILTLKSRYPELRLRLDANESWSINDAKLRLQELEYLNLEYIEQPVNQTDLLEYGSELRLMGTDIAADESARSIESIKELIQKSSADVFIIKPPMLGNFKMIRDACYEIKSAGCKIVFTSSLDSSLNVSMAALLASIWADPDEMHGFSTGNLFEKDLNPIKPDISGSIFNLDTAWIINPGKAVSMSLLTLLN